MVLEFGVDDERNKTSIATDQHWQWPPGNFQSTWAPSAGRHSIAGPVSLSGSVRVRKGEEGEGGGGGGGSARKTEIEKGRRQLAMPHSDCPG